MINRKYNGRKWEQVWWNQPPPSLPRRGGTVTITIDKSLIIRRLLTIILLARVSVPPLRGRIGGGWYDCLKKSLTKHSNLFLPLGNVRMGYPAGKVRMGSRPRGGWCHQTCFHFLPLYLRFIMVYRSVCLRVGDAQSPPSVGVRFPCRELSLVSGSRAASDKP